MKYWIFQNNQVCGPYEPEELARLPGYSAESLVCPEGRKGTSMGDWQRSSLIPDLAPAAAQKAAQTAEFSVKELALLHSLQEKVALLENTALRLQESLRAKEDELLGLRRELDSRQAVAADLQAKIQGLEERLNSMAQLRETVDVAVAAEKHVESEVKELEGNLEEQRRTITGLILKIEESQAAAAPAEAPAPEPLAAPEPAAKELPPIVVVAQPQVQPPSLLDTPSQPAPEPPPIPEQKAVLEAASMLMPQPQAAQDIAPEQTAQEPPPLLMPEQPTPPSAPTLSSKPKSHKKAWILAAAAFGGVGLLALIFLGKPSQPPAPLTPQEPSAPVQPVAQASAPAVPQAPQAPSPEAQLEELKHQAIALVQSWPTFDQSTSVGQRLEPQAPAEGNLSPWMAEKLKEDSFLVNFYGKKSEDGQQVVYSFVAGLGDKSVSPRNDAAKVLLMGEPARAKPKKVRIARKKAKKAPAPKPAEPPAQKTDEQLDKLLNP